MPTSPAVLQFVNIRERKIQVEKKRKKLIDPNTLEIMTIRSKHFTRLLTAFSLTVITTTPVLLSLSFNIFCS